MGRDYGFADVVLNGETVKVALFVMTLPYSDAIYMQAFPRECSESFLEGHKRPPQGECIPPSAVRILRRSSESDQLRQLENRRREDHGDSGTSGDNGAAAGGMKPLRATP